MRPSSPKSRTDPGSPAFTRRSGSAENEVGEKLGLRDVRTVSRSNLDRLNAEALARHVALPIRTDRSILGGDDVRGGNVVAQRDALIEGRDRYEEPTRAQRPLERLRIAV